MNWKKMVMPVVAIAPWVMAEVASGSGVTQGISVQGRLMNEAGTAPLSGSVELVFSILSPTGSCVLYEEKQSAIDLNQTDGYFSVQVGKGTRVSGRDPGRTMTEVFSNRTNISGLNCAYAPVSGDGRALRITVLQGASSVTLSPDATIASVPQALVAETLQGLTPADFALKSELNSAAGASFSRLNLSSGLNVGSGSSQFVVDGATGKVGIGTTSSFTANPEKLTVGGKIAAEGIRFPDGSVQTTNSAVFLYDASARKLGLFLGFNGNNYVMFPNGTLLGLSLSTGKPQNYCYFASSDCSGDCLTTGMAPAKNSLYLRANNQFVKATGTETSASGNLNSYWSPDSNSCQAYNMYYSYYVIPSTAAVVTPPVLGPYPTPLYPGF